MTRTTKAAALMTSERVDGVTDPTLAHFLASVREARSHLLAALAQTIPSDDEIIVGHIRDAACHLDTAEALARELERTP